MTFDDWSGDRVEGIFGIAAAAGWGARSACRAMRVELEADFEANFEAAALERLRRLVSRC